MTTFGREYVWVPALVPVALPSPVQPVHDPARPDTHTHTHTPPPPQIEDSRTTADMWDPSVYGKRLSDGFMAVWEHYLATGGAESKRKDIYVADALSKRKHGRGTAAKV